MGLMSCCTPEQGFISLTVVGADTSCAGGGVSDRWLIKNTILHRPWECLSLRVSRVVYHYVTRCSRAL
jgi:hypothetical protein